MLEVVSVLSTFFSHSHVNKNVSEYIRIVDAEYLYQNKHDKLEKYKRGGPLMYIVESDTLSMTHGADKRRRLSQDTIKEFVFETRHALNEDSSTQTMLTQYLQKMRELDKDTLHIGSIQQLKKTNPTLLKNFLQDDSIYISFWKKRYYDIFLPVEIK